MPIPIADKLSRGQSGQGQFPLVVQEDIRVGYVVVPDIATRNNIETWRRFAGLVVDVLGVSKFRLNIDLTTWEDIGTGSIPANVLTEDEILDEDGYIKAALIKNLFVNDSFVVASEAAMLALTTVTGNAVIRTDNGQVFIKLNNNAPATLSDFANITGNTGAVTSVNGQTGPVSISIANLLAVTQNLNDFRDAVAGSPVVVSQSSAIATIQGQITALQSSVSALQQSTVKRLFNWNAQQAFLIGEVVIASPSAGVLELFEVIQNTSIGKSPYDSDGDEFFTKVGNYYTKQEINTLLQSKADLVNGKVPLSQINTKDLGLKVFNDIAERNAFPDKYQGMRCFVIDATADPDIPDSPVVGAEYVYDPDDPESDAEGFRFIVISVGAAGGTASTTSFTPAGNIAATNVQAAIQELDSEKIPLNQKGANNGVATLDGGGKVPSGQLPSFVDDVLEFANLAAFPLTGESGKIYIALDTNLSYRWSGSAYIVISSTPNDASETVKGIAEIANQTESESAADAVLANRDHTRFLTPRGFRWAFPGVWNIIKDAATTIAAKWRFNDLDLINQIESGKQVGVYVRSSDGQLTKIPWLEYDVTNRKVLITGVNNLGATSSFDILNSDLTAIVRFFNDLRMEIGGTQFIIEPNNSVPSGNARVRLNDNQAMGLIFEDKNGKEYISIRTTDNDERFNMRVPRRLQTLGTTDSFYDDTQAQNTAVNAANGSVTLITSIPMNTDEEMVVVQCKWSAISNAGAGGRGIVEHAVQRISGGTVQDFGTQTTIDIKRTAGDFVLNIAADNTNKRININFVNNTSGGLAYKVTIHELSFTRILEP